MGCDDCEATVRRVAGVVCVTDFAGRVAPFTQQAESVIGVDPGVDPPEAWGQVRVAATGVQVGGEMVMTVDGDVLTATVAADTQAAMVAGSRNCGFLMSWSVISTLLSPGPSGL